MVRPEISLEQLSLARFAGCLEGWFRVEQEQAECVDLQLIGAVSLGASPDSRGRPDPFSLIFRGPRAPVLPQRMFQFEYEGLGTFMLFIVPIGPDSSGPLYQAVFN